MLVITRRPGESFFVGDKITITVTAIRGQQVAIAIDAPREVQIVRDNAKNYQPRPTTAG